MAGLVNSETGLMYGNGLQFEAAIGGPGFEGGPVGTPEQEFEWGGDLLVWGSLDLIWGAT